LLIISSSHNGIQRQPQPTGSFFIVLEYPVKPDSKAMTDKDNLFDENDHIASNTYGLSIMPRYFFVPKTATGYALFMRGNHGLL
jgi:hypothetical protein